MTQIKVINIRQPWAYLVINGIKDVENRKQNTKHRGEVFVLATKTMTDWDYEEATRRLWQHKRKRLPKRAELLQGGIIGRFTLTNVIDKSRRKGWMRDKWFDGPIGYVVANPEPLPFYSLKGLQNGRVYTHEVADSYLASLEK